MLSFDILPSFSADMGKCSPDESKPKADDETPLPLSEIFNVSSSFFWHY